MTRTTHGKTETPDTVDTILVVEGDVLVRLVIAEYLRTCGFRVLEASSGEEAMALLMHEAIAVDIVFSDVLLAGIDGFGLARWIRDHRPGLGVILAGSVPKVASTAAELCAGGTIPKPYEARVVLNRIRRLLATRAT